MLRKQIPFFAATCLLLAASFSLFAEPAKITLGGKDGWNSLSFKNSVVFGTGRFGYQSIELATDASRITPYTDVLISFENNKVEDSAHRYTVSQQNMDFTDLAVMGEGAGMNRGLAQNGIRMHGGEKALFGNSGLTGSFMIEFWLYPSVAESGEQIFNWRSSRNVGAYPLYQVIRADISNNHIEWVFDNIFGATSQVLSEVILTSADSIIPRKWAHHSLSYDDDNGLLEYRIDGAIQAVAYVTSNGRENGEIRNAFLGVPADFELCSKFNGCIDDFSIVRESYAERSRTLYAAHGGRFESQPLETNGYNSELSKLEAIYSAPRETDVAFYVRGGDNFYEWTAEYPEWVPVLPGEQIRGVVGRYFQVAADLYPDGTGSVTPSVSEITLTYAETTPPLPPATVKAVAGNGYVDLTWSSSVDFSVGGYKIYYGEHPGEYLGSIALEGVAPIDVGNVLSYRLNGLQNGRIYYFAVAAYSGLDARITGVLSKEVYARPLRKTKK